MEGKMYSKLPDIERTVIMDASIQKVWKAIATSEGLSVWFMPNDFQPVIGHDFTFIAEPRGEWDGIVHCKVMELEPPTRLGFTWCGNNMDQYVSFELKEIEGKTQLKLIHAGWSEEHTVIRDTMYDGWGYILEDLREKLGDKNGGYLS